MTHQNYQTNGASLEDCHTNFFALADLCGIKWKKLVLNERPNATGDPLDDPVLKSYTKCLAKDLLCVWRRVSQHKNDLDQTGGGLMFDLNQTSYTSVIHPPLSLTAAKELWIFWYGEEPDLTDLVSPELLKSSDSTEQGSWESGLSYECRSLLFKALHNLIERCLLSRDIVRLGKWFVQPSIDSGGGKSSAHLSFSFAFFVHGESTVCASMDIREHPPVRSLTEEYLNEVIKNSQQNVDDVEDQKDEFSDINHNISMQSVILAPFGLSAVLTGNKSENFEQYADKIINDWNAFYPTLKSNNESDSFSSSKLSSSSLPPLVEVISGGVKMLYPSKYVLITDIDLEKRNNNMCTNSENSNSNNYNNLNLSVNSNKKCINNNNSEKRMIMKMEDYDKDSIESNLLNICDGIQKTAANMPERVWQDMIMNPAYTNTGDKSEKMNNSNNSENNVENSINVANTENSVTSCNGGLWNFTEPCLKTSCSCKSRSGSFSSSLKAPGNSSSLSGKSNFRNNSNRTRTPFHKRSETSLLRSKDKRFSNEPTSSKKFNIRSTEKNSISNNNNNSNSCNQGIESIGSVGSITASPMQQNSLSVHSQPSSIPINDQNLISPNQNDVSPHPLTPILENNLNNASNSNNNNSTNNNLSGNNHDQKTENDDGKSSVNSSNVNTSNGQGSGCSSSSNGQMNNKHDNNLLQKQLKDTNNDANKLTNGQASNSTLTTIATGKENYLKRPALMIRDCEKNDEDDFMINQSLYDYSTWDAWMIHPIKRFKADDFDRNKASKNYMHDLYSGQKHNELSSLSNQQQGNMPNYLMLNNIKNELGGLWNNNNHNNLNDDAMKSGSSSSSRTGVGASGGNNMIKEIKSESESDKMSTEHIFPTEEGLTPSYADLTKIFDNSDDNSNDDHLVDNTPPGSNKSIGCHPDMELSEHDNKREKTTFSSPFSTLNSNGLTTLMNNVGGNSVNNTLGIIRNEELSKMFPTPPSIEQHTNASPGGVCGTISDSLIENIDTIASSSSSTHKSDAYPNFGSPPEEPIEDWSYVFIPPKMTSIVGSSKYAPLNNLLCQTLPPITLPSECNYKPSWIKQKEQQSQLKESSKIDTTITIKKEPIDQQQHQHQQPPIDIKKEIKMEPMSPMPTKQILAQLKTQNMKSSTDANANPIINKLLSQGPSNMYLNRNLHPPPSLDSPNSFQGNPYNSPYGMINRTPSHPPPPYEIHAKMNQVRSVGQPLSSSGSPKVSEANSLLLNILLYDTSLNIFRDHNFDSCTICVCNATPKCVGNIRGLDSGIYLSLATNCHFNSNLSGIVDKSLESHSVDPKSVTKYFGNSKNFIQSENSSSTSQSIMCTNNNNNNYNNNTLPFNELIPALLNNPPQLNLSGYTDEDPIICHCGFSAVINRRLAHQTGLFYEDEMEITGMTKDPSINKKRSFMALLSGKENDNATISIKKEPEEGKDQESSNLLLTTSISMSIFDLIRDQCSLFQNSSNTIQRAIKHLNQERYSPLVANKHVNILEFIDALDIVSLALEQSRYIFERFDGYNNRQVYVQQQQKNQLEKKSVMNQSIISVHKWPFLNAAGPKSNQDIIRVMKSMKIVLQKVFNQNGTTGLWDAPYDVRGPLTWREFHRLAGRGIGQCEPQPIPSIVVGHDKEWLCVAPYALQFWDKLLLEPYSYPRDIAYIVITPDNDYITSRVKAFFKELSTTYEMCRLGKHQPVKGWEGILKVGKPVLQNKREDVTNGFDDEWLQSIDSNKLNELLKLYSATFQQHLVPYLSKIPQDQTLLNPPESFYNYKDHHHNHHRTATSLPSPMLPPHTPESSNSSNPNAGPNTPKSDHDSESKDNLNNSSSGNDLMIHQQQQADQLLNPPHIVLYIVEPFTSGTDSTSLERVACLSLLKQYSNILNAIPESVKMNITLKIISQESILELDKSRDITRWSDHMRNLALSIFTQSHRFLQHTNNVKSLTGFGTAASAEAFMKTKDEKNRTPLKLYTPPYILSTRHAKSENVENFGQTAIEQQCTSIMYCCYCLSEDQSMLLAVITDERGEFLENCAINIDIPNRKKRRRSSARRVALKKLMDFILGVISQTVKPWRLVIGRIGRIGHGELKGWSHLLSKSNLVKASKYLKEICKQCQIMYTQAVPSIWSACLVTLEPDSSFRVMADQFTPDERFSQRSAQSPLSTPQDVTCTHILVFPTSAISQSSHTAFQEQHLESAFNFEGDLGILDIGEDADDVEDDINGFQHLLDEWNDSAVGIPQTGSPTRDSNRGSPIAMDENKSRQSPCMADQQGTSRAMFSMTEQEEVGQLLQQPLALGYLVSTAPTGRMPSWFWGSCPHLENVCPVFLKTALHIHSPSVHKENDDIYFKEQSSKIEHPLDSNTTADVLRYVLEGYNVLSWLAMDSNTHDRLSCLPIHVQMLMQLYHLHTALA